MWLRASFSLDIEHVYLQLERNESLIRGDERGQRLFVARVVVLP